MTYQTIRNRLADAAIALQQKDGGFSSFSSPDRQFLLSTRYSTTFTASLVLSFLAGLPREKAAKESLKKGAEYLLRQKSAGWSWNYWDRKSPQAKELPYPDDLDDTFCALNALCLADPSRIGGKELARIIQLLISQEIREGGPYKTWLVANDEKKQWSDTDIAVNANIAYFLFLNGITLPPLDRYIDAAIRKNALNSPYYPTPYPIIFYISRFYKGKYRKKLTSLLRKKALDPLNEALRLAALLNLGASLREVRADIARLSKQPPRAYPFCIDPSQEGRTMYNGAPALTAALMALALYRYDRKAAEEKNRAVSLKETRAAEAVRKNAHREIGHFHEETKKSCALLIDRTSAHDKKHEIRLLPYWWTRSMGKKANRRTALLGTANLFGWIAYRIYDDFLDGEGEAERLPIANLLHLKITLSYKKLLPAGHFHLFERTMEILERANLWEALHCRFTYEDGKAIIKKLPSYGNYSIIAEKSLGHALGPLAVSAAAGAPAKELALTSDFFVHYLIARQLNDDAHDWKDDLEKGFLNPANVLLLKEWKRKHGSFSFDRKKDMDALGVLFWKSVIGKVCRRIFYHTDRARAVLSRIPRVKDRGYMHALIEPLEASARQALAESRSAGEFIASYRA